MEQEEERMPPMPPIGALEVRFREKFSRPASRGKAVMSRVKVVLKFDKKFCRKRP